MWVCKACCSWGRPQSNRNARRPPRLQDGPIAFEIRSWRSTDEPTLRDIIHADEDDVFRYIPQECMIPPTFDGDAIDTERDAILRSPLPSLLYDGVFIGNLDDGRDVAPPPAFLVDEATGRGTPLSSPREDSSSVLDDVIVVNQALQRCQRRLQFASVREDFAIVTSADSDNVIGGVSLHFESAGGHTPHAAHVWIWLDAAYWGRGIASHALASALDDAFEWWGTLVVYAWAASKAARRFFEHLKFQLVEDQVRDAYVHSQFGPWGSALYVKRHAALSRVTRYVRYRMNDAEWRSELRRRVAMLRGLALHPLSEQPNNVRRAPHYSPYGAATMARVGVGLVRLAWIGPSDASELEALLHDDESLVEMSFEFPARLDHYFYHTRTDAARRSSTTMQLELVDAKSLYASLSETAPPSRSVSPPNPSPIRARSVDKPSPLPPRPWTAVTPAAHLFIQLRREEQQMPAAKSPSAAATATLESSPKSATDDRATQAPLWTAVGMIALSRRRMPFDNVVEIGYFVRGAYRNRGIATTAVRMAASLVDEAFSPVARPPPDHAIASEGRLATQVTRMEARVCADNVASIRVLENAGFNIIGTAVAGGVVDAGVLRDDVLAARTVGWGE